VFVACLTGVEWFRLGKNLYKFVWVCTDLDEVRTDFDKFVLWTMSKILVMFIAIYNDQKHLNTAENFILMAFTLL